MNVDPQRLKQLFLSAAEITAPAERAAFVARECGNDAELRRRLEVLLHAHDDSGGFLASAATVDPTPGNDEPTHGDAVGDVIGPYKLLQQIGEGGMGVVFLAEQSKPVQRRVALKIIKPGMDSRQVIARFEAERQALALMDHPNIAKVFDAGTTAAGRPYFVMELVKATPITTYCDEQRLPLPRRLELFVSVCQAIQHAHQKGIIHRDIKPSNVLVAPYDGKPVVKIIDFGIAKAMGPKLSERTLFTEFGAVVGTLQYMSPEQAELNNLDIDTRSDIYSLGVLLYELLTGTTPLDMKQLQEAAFAAILMRIQEQEPPRPSVRLSASKESLPSISALRQTEPAKLPRQVRGDLDWIVMKALEKDRGRRYETANGLARDIERYLTDEPVEASPPSVRYRLHKLVKRNRGVVLTASLVLLAVLAGTGASWWQAVRAEKARDLADDRLSVLFQDHERETRMSAELNSRAMKAEDVAKTYQDFFEHALLGLDLEYYLGRAPRLVDRDLKIRPLLDRAAKRMRHFPNARATIGEAALRRTLGIAYWALGQHTDAESHLKRSVEVYRAALGECHVDTMRSSNDLADLYTDWGKHDLAELLLRQQLDCYHQYHQGGRELVIPLPRPVTGLEVVYRLGLNLLVQRKDSESESLFREFMATYGKVHPESWLTFAARALLGAALLGQKKYAEAEPLLLAGYQGMKQRQDKMPPQGKLRLREALERLVQLYEATGNKIEAAKWRKELEEMKPSAPKKDVKP